MDNKQLILTSAVSIATRQGLDAITRKAVATRCRVAAGTISYHYPGMHTLVDAVMAHAVEQRILVIVAQGLAKGHKAARHAPKELKDAAASYLATA